mgnify:CR=1 FL=1|jgi:Signal transduction histidine kinase
MRIRSFICILPLAIVSFVAACAGACAAAPRAEDGVLDLRDAPLAESGPAALGGGWLFHDGVFLDPADPADPSGPGAGDPLVLKVPAAWNDQRPHEGGDGYGTYRLSVLLSDRDADATLGLDIPSIASAYTLYINGAKAASAGRIGASAGEMAPAARPQTIYFKPDGARVELLVHVSNFSQRKGGIWKDLKLGTAESIARESRNRILFQMSIAAGLLLMGVFHVGFHMIRAVRGDRSALWFGLACLLLCLRTMFTGDFLAMQLMPSMPWEAAVKTEYLSVFWGISLLVLYFRHLYPDSLNPRISLALAVAMIAATLPVLALPARVYTEWLLVYTLAVIVLILYILYGLLRAAWQRQAGAGVNLAAGLAFLAAALNDALYYNAALKTSDLVTLGLFLFIFTQMFMLARKSADAHRETRRLKNELESANANLERLVAMRTEALSRTNAMLKRSEQARSDLLNDITHELRNPLASIIGYLRRVIDGAAGHLQERHIEVAYQKALLLDHIVDDLRKLALLRRDDMSYVFRPIRLRAFCDALQGSYDWELLDRRIELRWDVPDEEELAVSVDLPRIEQVFANLVGNALTHTKAQDSIFISGRYYKSLGVCAVKVRDTGAGIDRRERPRIFERFYRGGRHDAAGGPGGSGLGLAIAKSITEAHRGRIGMYGEPGQGSTFYFILPVEKGA